MIEQARKLYKQVQANYSPLVRVSESRQRWHNALFGVGF